MNDKHATHERRLKAVLDFAKRCDFERGHTLQVTKLALDMFDQLQDPLGMDDADRETLQFGSLLHDIGWMEGQKKHHKTALRLILDAEELCLDARHRQLVGAVARYHRKALPGDNHAHFAALAAADKAKVCILGGILRIADGLDRSHGNVVEKIDCQLNPDELILHCLTHHPADAELYAAEKKADLLATVLQRTISIVVVSP
jgi:exopolyphosphatase/guanosine-5'-triphosphate,3'-diphosphate pyrophosphatase